MYVGPSIYSPPAPPPRPLQPSFATRPTTNLRYSRHAGSFGEPDFLHCLARPRHLSTTYRQSASFIVFLQRILFFLSPRPRPLSRCVCFCVYISLLFYGGRLNVSYFTTIPKPSVYDTASPNFSQNFISFPPVRCVAFHASKTLLLIGG